MVIILKNIEFGIDGWGVNKVEHFSTGRRTDQEGTLLDKLKEISHIESERYLGQLLSRTSNNTNMSGTKESKGSGYKAE